MEIKGRLGGLFYEGKRMKEAIDFVKLMASQNINDATDKAVYYMAFVWISKAKLIAEKLEEDGDKS